MTVKKMLQDIKKRVAALSAERDKLRGLLEEWEGLGNNCDEAIEHLERAADELSQMI